MTLGPPRQTRDLRPGRRLGDPQVKGTLQVEPELRTHAEPVTQPERSVAGDAATSVDDLRALPSNRLEGLKGNRAGQFSIRINQHWRICFRWPAGAIGPSDVEIVDYH